MFSVDIHYPHLMRSSDEQKLSCFYGALKSSLINGFNKDKQIRLYFFGLQNLAFILIKEHFYERLGDIANIKDAPQRTFCGMPLMGIELFVKTDDGDFFKKRVTEMFNGKKISYT